MTNRLDEFQSYRTRMNDRIAEIDHLGIKRFSTWTLWLTRMAHSTPRKGVTRPGGFDVLRCNDCIDYHILQCVEAGWKDEELYEAFNVALVAILFR